WQWHELRNQQPCRAWIRNLQKRRSVGIGCGLAAGHDRDRCAAAYALREIARAFRGSWHTCPASLSTNCLVPLLAPEHEHLVFQDRTADRVPIIISPQLIFAFIRKRLSVGDGG